MHSKLLEQAVDAFASLPGIGRKSALRFALHMMRRPQDQVDQFLSSIGEFRSELQLCSTCGYFSDTQLCSLCTGARRDSSTVCVVETVRDVMAIDATNQYFGLYHVLGGVISPIDGVDPEDLNIDALLQRCKDSPDIKEVILALSPSIEGDSTCYFIANEMKDLTHVSCSILSRGVSFGNELEFTDEVTLGRAILSRQPYDSASNLM